MSIAISVYDQPIWIPVAVLAPGGFQHWAASAEIPANARIAWADGGLNVECGATERGAEFVFRLPATAATPAGFSEWAISEGFPEHGRLAFLQQEIFIDMNPDELYKHSFVKKEIMRVIENLVRETRQGMLYPDGTLLRNELAGLSTVPDALFVSGETLQSNRLESRVRREHDDEGTELVGTPDWVLEIVSRSSVRKDKHVLRSLYHQAGIAEYWLVDALGQDIDFQILTHQPAGYAAAIAKNGWLSSPVFGRNFRLERRRNEWGYWEYTLDVAEPQAD